MKISRTKTSFYRRLLLTHLISKGVNTEPRIMSEIEIPRRTAQDSISSLKDLDIICSFKGELKMGYMLLNHGEEYLKAGLLKILRLLEVS